MPIYEYICTACGHQLEVIQKLSEAPLTTCPQCQAEKLRKQISAPAFRLSGSGWYETDFKSDKETRRNLAGVEADTSTDKKAEAKSDSPSDKSAAKSGQAQSDSAATPPAKAS